MGLGAVTVSRGRVRVWGRTVPRWLAIGVLLAVTVSLAAAFGSTFLHVYRLDREAARLEQMKRDLEEQNAVLREEIKLLHTPEYIEKTAREQLGLVRPGEIALLIVQSPADPPAADRPAPSRPGPAARLWQAVLRLFR